MHEKNNCEMLGYKKRSELAEKSKVFVKLTDADLRWLIPLAERTKKNATPLPHKSFTIKDMDGRWETLIYVQEIQSGKIRVDGYAPIDRKNGKKNAVVNIYETPYFSITFHFVLGVAECDSFFGRTVTKEKVWSDVKNRVIPIIIYMQNYYENAEKNEKKVRVRDRSKTCKMVQTTYTLKKIGNEIPTVFGFAGKKLKVQEPKFIQNPESVLDKSMAVFVDNPEDAIWMQKFADSVRAEFEKANDQQKRELAKLYPSFNSQVDSIIANEVTLIRAHASKESFMQLQIHKADENILQIDYYDDTSEKCQIILFVNIATNPAQYDIAYVSREDGNITPQDDLYARKVATFYVDSFIYLRSYDWEHATNPNGRYYGTTIGKFHAIAT